MLATLSVLAIFVSNSNNRSINIELMKRSIKTAAIGTLVSNSTNDVKNLCNALDSLKHLGDAAMDHSADILVFHDGLSTQQIQHLTTCVTSSNRTIQFPHVGYSFTTDFPPSFDHENATPNWQKRDKWSYQQMIRFWITKIWFHPALQGYSTLMRLDSDACWTSDTNIVPTLLDNKVYHANIRKRDSVCNGFRDFVVNYVKDNHVRPKNRRLYWRAVLRHDCPSFYNNFEISNIRFMKQPEVVKWHQALTEEPPFGVFMERWGDAMERFVTFALFATPSELDETKPRGYQHPCETAVNR